jgi:hypothetical protein
MAALTCITGDRNGEVCTPVALGSTNTITVNDANAGALLVVAVGGTPSNLTWTDAGRTPGGTAAATVTATTVAANTSVVFADYAAYADSTGTITFGLSSTTGATGMLIRKP